MAILAASLGIGIGKNPNVIKEIFLRIFVLHNCVPQLLL